MRAELIYSIDVPEVWVPICETGDFTTIEKVTIEKGTKVNIFESTEKPDDYGDGIPFAEIIGGSWNRARFIVSENVVFKTDS